mmetsp:Transcript_8358/g.21996  ORF Transcript_8358/g.21996 Transcript_8358/m.21996 type:complete len:1106 (+) Transcript_8358:1-3318(+)
MANVTGGKKEKQKKKKKKNQGMGDDEEDIDALLAEIDGPAGNGAVANAKEMKFAEDRAGAVEFGAASVGELAEPKLSAAEKKKLKKKQKKKADGAGHDDEDIDVLLASFGESAPPVNSTGNPEAAKEPEPVAESTMDTAADGADADSGAPLTAAQKKKLKKERQKAAKEADGTGGTTASTAAEASNADVKGKKKESAAVRKMREAIEKRKKDEEAAEAARLDAERRAEEKRRAEEEAERQRIEARERKKEADRLKREQLRKEGKLLSKSERERQRKAEQFREQLIAQGAISSAAPPDAGAEKPKRVVYDSRKRKSKQKAQESPQEAAHAEAAEITRADVETKLLVEEVVETNERFEAEEAHGEPAVADAWDEEDWESKVNALVKGAKSNVPEDDADALLARKADEDLSAIVAPEVKADSAAAESEVDDASGELSEEEESEEASEGESDSDGDSESSSEYDSSEYDDSSEDDPVDKQELEARARRAAVRERREEERRAAVAARVKTKLRSPIVCILGHVDTGKTKILDKIRRTNVQSGEAGGITQQIGATFFPMEAVKKEVDKLRIKEMEYRLPALLIIDTPGHESFTNLRTRGSSLCDIAILVVDIMHGIEPQTLESINLLKQRKNPFIVALNKVDRLFDWKAGKDCGVRDSLSRQKGHVITEFGSRVQNTKLAFAELGLNTELYWENPDPRKYISLVPTSAITGEGMPDLLMMLVSLSQKMLETRLMFVNHLQCTVIEVKMIEGLGTTIDVVLTGGVLKEGDTIVVCGLEGPIVSRIRGLLTPHPMKEMRVKGQYLHHKRLEAANGIKIAAEGLEKAVAGTQLLVPLKASDPDEIEVLKQDVMGDMDTILRSVDRSGTGVYVQASTLGSLEALLEFLRVSKIPVSGINIGPVNKRDIMKCSTMLERKKEYAVVLAFDVKVERDARAMAEELEIPIFTADIIYHLFDQFTEYMERVRTSKREAASTDVVFPAIIKILPNSAFNKKSPIVLGIEVEEGVLKVGTPLAVQTGKDSEGGEWLDIGRVLGIEIDKKPVASATRGDQVAVKIGGQSTDHIMYGRHFDDRNTLYSRLTRRSIDLLKEHFRDDLSKEDWISVIKLKKLFDIK